MKSVEEESDQTKSPNATLQNKKEAQMTKLGTKQRLTTKSIIHYFPSTNANIINTKQSSMQIKIPSNRSFSHAPVKTQRILQQTSAIRPPTNTYSLIKQL